MRRTKGQFENFTLPRHAGQLMPSCCRGCLSRFLARLIPDRQPLLSFPAHKNPAGPLAELDMSESAGGAKRRKRRKPAGGAAASSGDDAGAGERKNAPKQEAKKEKKEPTLSAIELNTRANHLQSLLLGQRWQYFLRDFVEAPRQLATFQFKGHSGLKTSAMTMLDQVAQYGTCVCARCDNPPSHG